MDDTLLLVAVGIVGPIAGAVVGYLLGRRLTRKDKEADRSNRRRESATALLNELRRIKEQLESGFPQYPIQAAYWQPLPRISTTTYDELKNQGRVVELGPKLAPMIDHAYDRLKRVNELSGVVETELAAVLHTSLVDVNAQVGDEWNQIWNIKTEFLRNFNELEAALQAPSKPAV